MYCSRVRPADLECCASLMLAESGSLSSPNGRAVLVPAAHIAREVYEHVQSLFHISDEFFDASSSLLWLHLTFQLQVVHERLLLCFCYAQYISFRRTSFRCMCLLVASLSWYHCMRCSHVFVGRDRRVARCGLLLLSWWHFAICEFCRVIC